MPRFPRLEGEPDGDTDAGRFAREGGRNRFTARRATVLRVERVAPPIVRVTVSGPEFADFTSAGPADHVRVFFPDAATGELVAPVPVGPARTASSGPTAPRSPETSRRFRARVDGGFPTSTVELDLDFFVHPDPGPASSWAESAQPGDELVVVGPRGSRRAPQDVDGLLLICDETSLPSVESLGPRYPILEHTSTCRGDPRTPATGSLVTSAMCQASTSACTSSRRTPRARTALAALEQTSTDRRRSLRLGRGRGIRSGRGAAAHPPDTRAAAEPSPVQRLLAARHGRFRPPCPDRPVRPRRVNRHGAD